MANTGDGLVLPAGPSVPDLTPEQRARLAVVQARLGVDEFANPNMADTPDHLAEHGFVFEGNRPNLIKG